MMMSRSAQAVVPAACVLALAFAAPSASAHTTAFTGGYEVINPVAAVQGRCAPTARTVVFGPGNKYAAGTSNLGNFTPSGSHCIKPPLPAPYDNGEISFGFSNGDTLVGTYDGALSLSGTPGVFNNAQDFVVTGGTGRFLAATGSFIGIGTVDILGNGFADAKETFAGTLSLPAVPEPATWMMMIAGFGCIGAVARRREVPAVGRHQVGCRA